MGIIVYGLGHRGKMVIDFFGPDKIKAVVDSFKKNEIIQGITVSSLNDIEISCDDIIIIAIDGEKAREVSANLSKKQIYNYLYWDEVLEMFGFSNVFNNSFESNGQMRSNQWVKNSLVTVEKILDLKENLESVVEFYVTFSFEILHFLPFYNGMKNRGINVSIVLEHPAINVAQDFLDYAEAVRTLNKNNIRYETKSNPNALLAFTTQYIDVLIKYKNKKIIVPYGVSLLKEKSFQLKKETLELFDFVLVSGEFSANIVKENIPEEKVIEIGYPKYAFISERNITKDRIINELNIMTNKPILVYFPTWDEYSSIVMMKDNLVKLKEEFYVVAKPHHCTTGLPEKENEYKILLDNCDLVLGGNYDFYSSSILADIAIVDAKSGAITEVPFANHKVKLLAIMNGTVPDDYHFDLESFTELVYKTDEVFDKCVALKKVDNMIEKRKEMSKKFYGEIGEDIDNKFTDTIGRLEQIINQMKYNN